MDGTDVCVGMTVKFRAGFENPPAAGIVTSVGVDRVSVHVFYDGHAQPDLRTGVMHSSHPEARKMIELNEDGGIWDYVDRVAPREVDKSKDMAEAAAKPSKKVKPPSPVRDVAAIT